MPGARRTAVGLVGNDGRRRRRPGSRRFQASRRSSTSRSPTSRSRAQWRARKRDRRARPRRHHRRRQRRRDRRPLLRRIEEQILAAARIVKAAGGTALEAARSSRAASPYSFQGLGNKGLQLLARARRRRDSRSSPRRWIQKKARTSWPKSPTASRSARATCRTIRCSRPSGRRRIPCC